MGYVMRVLFLVMILVETRAVYADSPDAQNLEALRKKVEETTRNMAKDWASFYSAQSAYIAELKNTQPDRAEKMRQILELQQTALGEGCFFCGVKVVPNGQPVDFKR